MMLYETLFTPFMDYGFMRRALVACIALSLSSAPLGVFLVMRRMALVGDAMSHAILPGAAIAFLWFGLALWPMAIGGAIAGVLVALVAGAVSRLTTLKEDASFTGAYLLSLAVGVLVISVKGSTVDLMHVLFGNVLAIDNHSLWLVAGIASISTLALAVLYRGLIMECCDPVFLQSVKAPGNRIHQLFLLLVVFNLVAAFQTLGTLMALGIMVLPAIAARFWTRNIDHTLAYSILFGIASSYAGLLVSYHFGVPSGPAIVLTAGGIYLFSVVCGSHGSIRKRFLPHYHFTS